MQVKVYTKHDYLFIESDEVVCNGKKTNFEFQKQPDGLYDVLFKKALILDGLPYSNFNDETNTPFVSANAFEDFYTENSSSGGDSEDATAAKQDQQTAVLEQIRDALTVPLQSETFNIGVGETGSFTAGFYQIINTGNSDILIDGEVWKSRAAGTWQGSFDYDSQASTITVILNP